MTIDLGDKCRQRLEEVKQWFESLPEGVAEIEERLLPDVGVIILTIRPLINPDATEFGVHFLDDEFHIGTDTPHEGFREIPCTYSAVEYCRAIVSGELTIRQQLWKGIVVSERIELQNEDPEPDEYYAGCGCLLAPVRWLLRGKEERVIRYASYY